MSEKPGDENRRTFQEQAHFMTRQAQMLAEEGNDVSSRVMMEALGMLTLLHAALEMREGEIRHLKKAQPSRASIIEEAAQVCEQFMPVTMASEALVLQRQTLENVAQAIRALRLADGKVRA